MKIKQQKSHKKAIISVVIALLIVVLAGATTYAILNKNKQPDANSDSSHKSTTDNTEPATKDVTSDKTSTNTDTPPAPTTDKTTGKSVVTMVASANTSGSTVYIRGGVNAVVSGGSCYAQLSGPNGESVQKTTTLVPSASTTDCKTISIDSNTLSKGTWSFKLVYTSDTTEGSSSESSFTVQ